MCHRATIGRAHRCLRRSPRSDDAVSPIVGVVLMVVVTVILAGSAYLWFSTMTGEGSDTVERAGFSVERVGIGTSSDTSWVKVALIHDGKGERALDDLRVTWLSPDGRSLEEDTDGGILCTSAQARTLDGNQVCDTGVSLLDDTSKTHWTVGAAYYIPCQDEGRHALTIAVDQQTVLDTGVTCDKAAG